MPNRYLTPITWVTVVSLALVALAGVVMLSIMTITGHDIPPGLVAIPAAAVGALAVHLGKLDVIADRLYQRPED